MSRLYTGDQVRVALGMAVAFYGFLNGAAGTGDNGEEFTVSSEQAQELSIGLSERLALGEH